MNRDFQQRDFDESQKVYNQIVGPPHAPLDVDAALWDAHLKASSDEGEQ